MLQTVFLVVKVTISRNRYWTPVPLDRTEDMQVAVL